MKLLNVLKTELREKEDRLVKLVAEEQTNSTIRSVRMRETEIERQTEREGGQACEADC